MADVENRSKRYLADIVITTGAAAHGDAIFLSVNSDGAAGPMITAILNPLKLPLSVIRAATAACTGLASLALGGPMRAVAPGWTTQLLLFNAIPDSQR